MPKKVFSFKKTLKSFTKIEWVCVLSIIRVESMASGWSGQNEDICPSIKKSMARDRAADHEYDKGSRCLWKAEGLLST